MQCTDPIPKVPGASMAAGVIFHHCISISSSLLYEQFHLRQGTGILIVYQVMLLSLLAT
jgi:hypothetical protein